MTQTNAIILRDLGPFPGITHIHGVTFDGRHIWAATGDRLVAMDPHSGAIVRALDVAAQAGTAFDGRHLFQIAGERIQKIDPASGAVLATIPAPEGGNSGMAWAEGCLWVGQYRARKVHQVDPATGAILRTLETGRFVTGVTWAGEELWHGTYDDGEGAALLRVDPGTGATLETVPMPPDVFVSGLESDGADGFFCGGASSGRLRVVRRPRPVTAGA